MKKYQTQVDSTNWPCCESPFFYDLLKTQNLSKELESLAIQFHEEGYVILDLNWVSPYLMQFFESVGYKFKCCMINFSYLDNINVYKHVTRPEDTFYLGARGGWEHFKFDYSDVTNVSSFIKNNKKQLKEYYDNHLKTIEITDTHYYTEII